MAFPALHCSPTVFGPSTQGLTIAFETQVEADAYLEYGPTSDNLPYTSPTQSTQTRFSFHLTNPAGTALFYRVLGRQAGQGSFEALQVDGSDVIFEARTARASDDDTPWSFEWGARSFLDETHLGTSFLTFLGALGNAGTAPLPEFGVNVGDVTACPTDGVAGWRTWRAGLGVYLSKAGGFPVFCALGDQENDLAEGRAAARMALRPLGSIGSLIGQQTAEAHADWQERYYFWTWGRCLFVVLDDRSFASGDDAIGAEQRAWLEAVLEAHVDVRWKFVFSSRPLDEVDPIRGGGHASFSESSEWLSGLVDTYGVQVFGHGGWGGWRHATGGGGTHFCCGSFGAAVEETGSEDWYAEERFWRVRVGLQWDGAAYVENAEALCFALVDPTSSPETGGVEVGYFNVFASDNPSEAATTTTTSTQTTTTSPWRRRVPSNARWERRGLDLLIRPMRE